MGSICFSQEACFATQKLCCVSFDIVTYHATFPALAHQKLCDVHLLQFDSYACGDSHESVSDSITFHIARKCSSIVD